MMKQFLFVGLGGAIGTMLRYAGNLIYTNKTFPFTTFIINIAGSFVIGIILGYALKNESFSQNWKLFFATGICGGFTTFSAFSYENFQLLQQGKLTLSVMYIFGSILMGIAATAAGFKLIN